MTEPIQTESAPSLGAAPAAVPAKGTAKSTILVGVLVGGCGCLLVAIFMVGILAAIALPNLFSAIDKAKEGNVHGAYGAMNSALAMYFGDKDKFPVTDGSVPFKDLPGIRDYLTPPEANPWQKDYMYIGDGTYFCLWTETGQGDYLIYSSSHGRIRKDAHPPERPKD